MNQQGTNRSPKEIKTRRVSGTIDLLNAVKRDSGAWEQRGNVRPWFRGQSDAGRSPVASVFRKKYDEFWLTTMFRLKALAFGADIETQRLDQWLFLAQHYRLPTRLLDWTESPLLACFFAAAESMDSEKAERDYCSPDMAIWMLHPTELNGLSGKKIFPNTWVCGSTRDNFRTAFHPPDERPGDWQPTDYPVAVQASAVDRRVVVQRSCFTIHGRKEDGFEEMLAPTPLGSQGFFRKYVIRRSKAPKMLRELDSVGVSYSTVYPDLAGLAKELRGRFGPPQGRRPAHRSSPATRSK